MFGLLGSTIQSRLNRSSPVAREAMLGDMLNDIITSHNALLSDAAALRALENTATLTKAGLAINAAASPLVKTTAPLAAVVAGAPVRKAAGTAMPALAGALATAKSALWAFYIDGLGNLTVSAKTADAATHDAAVALLPTPPAGVSMIGFVVVDNATGANFVGGTTALDAASLTVTYYDTIGSNPFPAAATSLQVLAIGAR